MHAVTQAGALGVAGAAAACVLMVGPVRRAVRAQAASVALLMLGLVKLVLTVGAWALGKARDGVAAWETWMGGLRGGGTDAATSTSTSTSTSSSSSSPTTSSTAANAKEWEGGTATTVDKAASEIGDVQQRYQDPLLVAVQGGKFEDFRRELAKAGFQRMEEVDKAGATPLLYAQLISKSELVRAILTFEEYPLHQRMKWLTAQYHLPPLASDPAKRDPSPYSGENILHICVVQKNMSQLDFFLSSFEHYGKIINLSDAEDDDHPDNTKLTVREKLLVGMAVGRFFQPRVEMWDEFGKRTARIARSPDHLYFGESPLAFAVCTNQLDMVTRLVTKYGARIDVEDSHGNNLLHLAVMHELPQAYRRVLELCGDEVDPFKGLVSSMATPLWKRENHKGLTPLCLAANLGLTQMFKFQMDLRRLFHWRYASITAWAYDLEELLKPNGAVAQIVQRENTQLVDDPLIECLLGLQWDRGLGNIFFWQMRKTLFAIVVLTVTSVVAFTFPFVREWAVPDPFTLPFAFAVYVLSWMGNSLLFVAASGKLQTEMGEMARKGRDYLSGSRTQVFENVFSSSTSVLTLALIFTRHLAWVTGLEMDYYEHLLAAGSNLMGWFYSLFFLLGFEDSGQFVVMLWRMLMRDVAVFAGVFSVFLFGFSSSFFHLNTPTEKGEVMSWQNYSQHLENSFSTMLGNYDLQEFRDGEYSAVAIFLYLMYTILCTVLLFNVLIARMTNTIENIQSSSRNLWIIERARIMQSIADEYEGGWDELVQKKLVDQFWIPIKGKKYMEVHIEDPEYFENLVAATGEGEGEGLKGTEEEEVQQGVSEAHHHPLRWSAMGASMSHLPHSIVVDGVRYFQSPLALEQEKQEERSRISVKSPNVAGGSPSLVRRLGGGRRGTNGASSSSSGGGWAFWRSSHAPAQAQVPPQQEAKQVQ